MRKPFEYIIVFFLVIFYLYLGGELWGLLFGPIMGGMMYLFLKYLLIYGLIGGFILVFVASFIIPISRYFCSFAYSAMTLIIGISNISDVFKTNDYVFIFWTGSGLLVFLFCFLGGWVGSRLRVKYNINNNEKGVL
jgi:hypothetical protein